MIPWVHLDTAKAPGGEELRLWQRDREFSIRLGRTELMNSRLSGSEEALATLSFRKMGQRPHPQVLIGGLGMGFTLRAALAGLPADAHIVVSELVPAVVAWARGPMAEMFGDSLTDPRVAIETVDVGRLIKKGRARYDAILLDVDNGPEGLTRESNDGLYGMQGLGAAKAALRPGGVLAVWSCFPDDRFAQRLRRAGFAVEEEKVRAHRGRKGARHVIWIATADTAGKKADGGGREAPAKPGPARDAAPAGRPGQGRPGQEQRPLSGRQASLARKRAGRPRKA